MLEFISFAIGIAGTGFGVWQWLESKASSARMEATLHESREEARHHFRILSGRIKVESPDLSDGVISVQLLDVDNDGFDEVLLRFPAGAYAEHLAVLKLGIGEYREIGYLVANGGPRFEFKDVDGDGKLEILTYWKQPLEDVPMCDAPVVSEAYRWDGNKFAQISLMENGGCKQ